MTMDEDITGDHALSVWLFFVFLHYGGVDPYIFSARLEIPSLLLLLLVTTLGKCMRAACEPSFCFGEPTHTPRGSGTRMLHSGQDTCIFLKLFLTMTGIRSGKSCPQVACHHDCMYLKLSNLCTPDTHYLFRPGIRDTLLFQS